MNNTETMELKVSKFLRYGVIITAILMLTGFILQFEWSLNVFYVFDTYDQIPFQDLLESNLYRRNWGHLLSYLALIILIALPIIRVFLTAIIFLKQKEIIMAVIAFLVLLSLLFSASFGLEL